MKQDEWVAAVAAVVAGQVRHYRKEKKMSAQRLADACTEAGLSIPRSVLANLENGRRPTITVAELLVLAKALDVPPALLLFPVGRTETVEALPDSAADPWAALLWFAGFEDDSTGVVEMVTDHRTHSEEILSITGELLQYEATLADEPEARERQLRMIDLVRKRLARAEQGLLLVRREMREKGLMPPQLWPQLRYLKEKEKDEQSN